MKYKILIGILLLHLTNTAYAVSSASDLKSAMDTGKNIGRSGVGKAQSTLTGGLDASVGQNVTVGQAMGFKGTDIPEKNLTESQMDTEAKSRFANAKEGPILITKDAAIKSLDQKIDKNASFLDRAKAVQKEPEKYVDWLVGKYTDCEHKIEGGTKYNTFKTCDIFTGISDQACKIGRAIEVDAKHDYECFLERKTFSKTCIKKLKVSYEQGEADCNNFNVTSASAGINHNYVYPNLTINYLNQAGHYTNTVRSYNGQISFNINNIKTTEKAVIKISHVGTIIIKVNGNNIYSFPMGANTLCIGFQRCEWGGGQIESCRCDDSTITVNGVVGEYIAFPTAVPNCYSRGQWFCESTGSPHPSASDSNIYLKEVDITGYLKQGGNQISMMSGVHRNNAGNSNQLTLQFKNQCIVEQSSWEETCS